MAAYAKGKGYLDAKAEVEAGAKQRRSARKSKAAAASSPPEPSAKAPASKPPTSSTANGAAKAAKGAKAAKVATPAHTSGPSKGKSKPITAGAQANGKQSRAKPKAKRQAAAQSLLPPGIVNAEDHSDVSRVCFAIASVQVFTCYPPFAEACRMLSELPARLASCESVTRAFVPLVQALRQHLDLNALFQQFARVALLNEDTH